MAEPLFTKCDVEFVPIVDFNFIDVCEIPSLPPPIFDCGAPLCPPPEPPPFCPQITGGAAEVTVTSVPAGCPIAPTPSGALTVTPSGTCEFNISLALDIPVIEPPCPKLNAGEVTVNANYGSCETSSGTLTIDTTPKENPCENGACEFDIALDLNVNIPPPPCPNISVSSQADDKASGISGTGEVTQGKCDTPNCDIAIKLTHPPILTVPDITTITTTTLINNFGPTLNTYLSVNTNLETFIDIAGPTLITYIDTKTSAGNGLCVPKFKAGKIDTCESSTPSASLTIDSSNDEKKYCRVTNCQGGQRVTTLSAFPSHCYFDGPEGVAACRLWASTAYDCIEAGGIPYTNVPTTCQDVSGQANPEEYCSNIGGTLASATDCGVAKKCPDQIINGKICFPKAPCVPAYTGGDISVTLSSSGEPPKGELSVGEPTKDRSCYYPAGSDGAFLLLGAAGADEGICTNILDGCAANGGSLSTSASCSPSTDCPDKEISATLTLPDSLCDIKFKKGIGNLQHYDCGGDDPYVTIQVEINKSTAAGAKSNEYEISISGTFCSCCGAKAEVEG